jgi:putative phage-type endonuclease
MSFGNISKILDKTYNLVQKNPNKNFSNNDLISIKIEIYNQLSKEFSSITPNIIDEIFNRLIVPTYNFEKNICFDNGINCFREFEETYPGIKIPAKYKKLSDHFDKLQKLPQPAQRSKEWYDYRYNRITASDAAAAIDLNPFESFILKKCDPNFPFRDNATVFHGKKYEPTATMIYEHIYNTRVFEFGALPSDKYNILGASPDGISSRFTLDNKFSERLGTMLEIKCPVTRDIHTSGNIVGDICPFYYYCQVQQQLICCELDVCDFWQCKLSEYKNRLDYLADNCKSCASTIGNKGEVMVIDDRLKKGIILEFYPKNFIPEFEGDLPEWKSKYIIPKRLDMDSEQYNTWTIKMLDEYKELYSDISKDYYFYRIIYWKLEMSHNVAIQRDDKFFGSILPILEDTWEKIIYYRKNQDKLEELKKIVTKRKKYIKMNLTYTVHNDLIIKNKALILNKNFDCKTLFVAPIVKKNNYYSKNNNYIKKEVVVIPDYESDKDDFEDNCVCEFIDS